MQATDLRNNYSYRSSDTYSTAYRHAREALGVQPVSNQMLAMLDLLSSELAAGTRDSSENLRDVRKICRRGVIDAVRAHMREEIDRMIGNLDDIRRSGVSSTVLDRAICSALGARVSLDSAPFHETLRHLESARTLRDNLSSASETGEHVGRMNRGLTGIGLSFDAPTYRGNRA